MKKLSVLFFTVVFAFFVFVNFTIKKSPADQDEPGKVKTLPVEVSKIVENKCFGCHNSESRNDKAKEKLSFDKLDSLNTFQKLGKFKDIHESITKAEMPPEKFLERFPDKKLTDDESKVLIDWAKKELDK